MSERYGCGNQEKKTCVSATGKEEKWLNWQKEITIVMIKTTVLKAWIQIDSHNFRMHFLCSSTNGINNCLFN